MRHKKSFFTKNNSLNRVGGSQEKKAGLLEESFLDPNTLLEYEKQIPGFAEKLFELAKADQHHMQQIEKIRNNMTQNAMRMGRFTFVLLFIVICYFAYNLIFFGMVQESYIFSAISFIALLMLNCSYSKSCRKSSDKNLKTSNRQDKKHPRKPYTRRRPN